MRYAPPVLRARNSFVRCMRAAGYDVGSPLEAQEVASSRFKRAPDDPPSAAEVAMATAHARCLASSRILDIADREVLRGASAWLQKHEQEVLGELETLREALRRAKEVLKAEPQ